MAARLPRARALRPGAARRAGVAVVPTRPAATDPIGGKPVAAPAGAPLETLLVSSTPAGARVFIDGVEKGNDAGRRAAPAGAVTRAGGEGRLRGGGAARPARPRALAGASRCRCGAQASGARSTCISVPDGGRLTIDGEPAGSTNALNVPLAYGFHVVEVRKPGFLPWVEEIVVGLDTGRVTATLVEEPREKPERPR